MHQKNGSIFRKITRHQLLLVELRLPAVKAVSASLAAQAGKEGWPAGRFLRQHWPNMSAPAAAGALETLSAVP